MKRAQVSMSCCLDSNHWKFFHLSRKLLVGKELLTEAIDRFRVVHGKRQRQHQRRVTFVVTGVTWSYHRAIVTSLCTNEFSIVGCEEFCKIYYRPQTKLQEGNEVTLSQVSVHRVPPPNRDLLDRDSPDIDWALPIFHFLFLTII